MNMMKLSVFAFSLLFVSSVLMVAARADVAADSLEAVYGPEIEERWFSGLMLFNHRQVLMRGGPHGDHIYDPNDINDVKRAAVDPQMYPKRAAALSLLTYRIRGDAKEMLLAALADPYVLVRCEAAKLLAILGDPNGLASMRRDLAELTDESAVVDIESMSTKERVRQDFWGKHPHIRTGNALKVAEVLAEFGDTSGFAVASQVILQEEPSVYRNQAARIVAELGKLPDSELKAKHCDPDAVLIAMAERETEQYRLRLLRTNVLRMTARPASVVKVLERIEQAPAYSGLDDRDRLITTRLIENARQAAAKKAVVPDASQDEPQEIDGEAIRTLIRSYLEAAQQGRRVEVLALSYFRNDEERQAFEKTLIGLGYGSSPGDLKKEIHVVRFKRTGDDIQATLLLWYGGGYIPKNFSLRVARGQLKIVPDIAEQTSRDLSVLEASIAVVQEKVEGWRTAQGAALSEKCLAFKGQLKEEIEVLEYAKTNELPIYSGYGNLMERLALYEEVRNLSDEELKAKAIQEGQKTLQRLSRDTAPMAPTRYRVIEAQDEYNQEVRSKLVGGGLLRIDSRGIKNSVPADYNDSTPLIEIRTFERQLDGTVRPLYLDSLGLQAQQHFKGSGGREVTGYGLRTGLASKEDGLSYLVWDTEYRAVGTYHRPEDPNYVVRGSTDTVRFSTPTALAPGEIFRVDLVLVDRVKEAEAAEQARIAEEERARVEEEETITLRFGPFPAHEELGGWIAGYHDGDRSRGFDRAEDGSFVLKGPNALGGDIAVCFYDVNDYQHPWLYVANVQKRTLQLPADASIVVNEADMVPARISLAQIDPNVFSQVVMVGFYTSEEAKLPLLGKVIRSQHRQDLQANDWQIDMKVPPGTYWARLIMGEDEHLYMGTVDFTKQGGRIYALRLSEGRSQ